MQHNGLKKTKTCCLAAFKGLMGFPAHLLSSCRGATIHEIPFAQHQQERKVAHSHRLTFLDPMLAPGNARMLMNPATQLQAGQRAVGSLAGTPQGKLQVTKKPLKAEKLRVFSSTAHNFWDRGMWACQQHSQQGGAYN